MADTLRVSGATKAHVVRLHKSLKLPVDSILREALRLYDQSMRVSEIPLLVVPTRQDPEPEIVDTDNESEESDGDEEVGEAEETEAESEEAEAEGESSEADEDHVHYCPECSGYGCEVCGGSGLANE